jgi:hypothetical protein
LSKWFQTRRFLWEFPIGSYVKLSSAVAAILVGGLKCGPLPKLCPVIPTSNQDGRQAKNRKKGDEIKRKSSPLKLLSRPGELKMCLILLYNFINLKDCYFRGKNGFCCRQSIGK